MKKLFYIFFSLLLTSCGLFKKTNTNVDNNITHNEVTNIDTTYVDDSTMVRYVDKIESEPIVLKSESNPNRDKENVDDGVENNTREQKNINRSPSSIDERPVEDRTTQEQIDNTNLGIIAYSIPKEMQVGKTYTVKLRISKEKNKVQLITGNGIAISDVNIDSRIVIASIKVEPIMSAKLISDSSKMSIQQVSTETQNIEKEGFTEWEWRLTPINGGDVLLRIIVSVKQKIDDDVVLKDIPVYDDVIKIKSNVTFTISGFLQQYWQWLMTTIIIPFIVWFYNKKKKKKN